MDNSSLTANAYFVIFVDDFSRYTTVYFLKQKSQVFSCFKDHCSLVLRMHDLPVQVLRSDNGGEYVSRAFQQFCKSEGIQQQFSIPYTPQQNGVSERKIRTLVEVARAMILTAGLSKSYWEEAIATACYLQNRIPHASDPQRTPYFHWFGKVPNLEHVRVFGCSAYAVQPLATRQKFDPASIRMVFVGYGDRFGVKAYRLYDPIQQKFHFARSVHFDETSLLSPQPGEEDSLTKPNPRLLPTPPPPTLPVPLPQVEWQESEPDVHPDPQQAPQQFHPDPLPA
ncbi:hypothetical protein L7F22_053491 [Adiantum nelumboides]|nr:hypothetical protein [Adiantum nelumboides]